MKIGDDVGSLLNETSSRKPEKPRAYIGASIIGGDCTAYLCFHLRGYPNTPIKPRTQRIFRDGHRIEDQVVKDMRAAGIHVMDRDLDGRQHGWQMFGGHVDMHADGLVDLEELCLLEIKSMNAERFKDFQDRGIKYSNKKYYAQVQMMMHAAKIRHCMFVCYNKNDGTYDHEWIEYDEFYASALVEKITRVMRGERHRLTNKPDDFRCRFCEKRAACWEGELPEERNMRTCGNSDPMSDGSWSCSEGCKTSCLNWKPFTPEQAR